AAVGAPHAEDEGVARVRDGRDVEPQRLGGGGGGRRLSDGGTSEEEVKPAHWSRGWRCGARRSAARTRTGRCSVAGPSPPGSASRCATTRGRRSPSGEESSPVA